MQENIKIDPSWLNLFEENGVANSSYMNSVRTHLKACRENKITVYPVKEHIFNAFKMPVSDINVVILGQDPYHGAGQAHGYCFSVLPGVRPPPSLQNIFKEIEREYGVRLSRSNGFLQPWVDQGVFLLNSVLTVEDGKPASHKNIGWGPFTDFVISQISLNATNVVFMLWGAFAMSKQDLIQNKNNHLILTSAHPSPLSAHKFLGNNHFLKANEYLESVNKQKIDWITGFKS